jgi:peptide/nickel transport system permease protein
MTALDQITIATDQRPPSRAWRKLKANKGAIAGLAIIAFFAILATAAPLLPIPDPIATSWSAIRKHR